MKTEAGVREAEQILHSIEKIGDGIESKNSKKNKEINKSLRLTKKECNDVISSYSDAFDIHQ